MHYVLYDPTRDWTRTVLFGWWWFFSQFCQEVKYLTGVLLVMISSNAIFSSPIQITIYFTLAKGPLYLTDKNRQSGIQYMWQPFHFSQMSLEFQSLTLLNHFLSPYRAISVNCSTYETDKLTFFFINENCEASPRLLKKKRVSVHVS